MDIKKSFALFIFLALFATAGQCQQEETPPDHFSCDYYHYFRDTAYPMITKEDSIQLERYSKKYHKIANRHSGFKASLFYFLPFVNGTIDTIMAEKLEDEVKTFRFNTLKYADVYPGIIYDAMIMGIVIDKRQFRDTIHCLKFKTEYVIEVTDVIHSYFGLKKGDKVLVKDVMGYIGCGKRGDQVKLYIPDIEEYNIGDESFFVLDRNSYISAFLNKHTTSRYDDVYCPQSFMMHSGSSYYNENIKDKIYDLKLFFEVKLKKR